MDSLLVDGVDDFFQKGRFVSLVLVLCLMIWAVVRGVLSPLPPIPASHVDGTYVSACCGSVTFRDGLVSFSGHAARYRLSLTKTSLSAQVDGDLLVAANHSVTFVPGVQESGITFWRYNNRYNMEAAPFDLRREAPDRVTLWGQDNSGPYDFALAGK